MLTKSRPPELLGSLVPTYEHLPSAKSSAGQEAVDLAASVGLMMDEAQQRVLHGALGERSDHTWAAFEVAVIVARQNLKTTVARVRQASGLYLFGERLQTHTAHRADTCLEQFRYMKTLCERLSDEMGDRKLKLKRISETNGKESIELMSGQRLQFKARVKESGRGFDGEVVYLDEAMRLSNLGDMIPTMSAQPNPQLWYLSSGPLPKIESDILRGVCRRGRNATRGKLAEPDLYYAEWCAHLDPGLPPPDEDSDEYEEWYERWRIALAEANPALGRRITEKFCVKERRALTWDEHALERLGIWNEDLTGTEACIDEDDWKACSAPTSQLVGRPVLVFEVSVDRKTATIAAVGTSSAGGTHVEVVEHRAKTGWVVARLVALKAKHNPAAIVCNPAGPAGALLKACAEVNLDVGMPVVADGKVTYKPIAPADYKQACQLAFDDIAEHRWRHIDQPNLTAAVTGAAKKDQGDGFVFDRRGLLDIAPLTAVSLGAWVLGQGPGPSVYEERGIRVL